MGEGSFLNYYIKYIFDKITGLRSSPVFVDKMTFCAFFSLLVLSVTVNYL